MPRFFADDSFWNQPIGREAQVDPRSDEILEILARDPGGPFYLNMLKWTIPVYHVYADTPRQQVAETKFDPAVMAKQRWGARESWFHQGESFEQPMPIPAHAQPDPAGDGHLAVVDWQAGKVWDMWACRKRADGTWESNTGMAYSATGSGVFETAALNVKDGESVHFHGPGRAAGVPIVAGLAMHEEIANGLVPHRLAFGTWHNTYKEFVFPAAWTDGFCDRGIPEGAVMQLDPSLDPAAFDLSPGATAIFRALQRYGMVNVDNAKGNSIYLEGIYAQPGRTWKGLVDRKEFYRVPLKHYRVLKIGPITHVGDAREKDQH